jgi:hypothetical protein
MLNMQALVSSLPSSIPDVLPFHLCYPLLTLELVVGPAIVFVNDPLSMYTPLK